jgi:hypothetical protein
MQFQQSKKSLVMTPERIKVIRGRCEVLVIVLVGAKMAPQWWSSKNKAFDMRTPEEQFDFNPESVYNYLVNYSDGSYH